VLVPGCCECQHQVVLGYITWGKVGLMTPFLGFVGPLYASVGFALMLLEEESLCLRGIYLTLGVRGSVSVLNCAVWDLLCLGDGSSTYRLEMLIEWHYPPRLETRTKESNMYASF
jgi:hypothetical protein